VIRCRRRSHQRGLGKYAAATLDANGDCHRARVDVSDLDRNQYSHRHSLRDDSDPGGLASGVALFVSPVVTQDRRPSRSLQESCQPQVPKSLASARLRLLARSDAHAWTFPLKPAPFHTRWRRYAKRQKWQPLLPFGVARYSPYRSIV
jgi:hypothetical protein